MEIAGDPCAESTNTAAEIVDEIPENKASSPDEEITENSDNPRKSCSRPMPFRYKPMPRSKKKEREKLFNQMRTTDLIANAIIIAAEEPIEDTAEESSGESIDHPEEENEAPDEVPTLPILPEAIDVIGDEFTSEEETDDQEDLAEDVLAGVDVFKDVKVAEEDEPTWKTKKRKAEEAGDTSSSESSSNLSDLVSEYTPEELEEIKRRRKERRQEGKSRQRKIEKERQEMLAKGKKDRFFDKSRSIPNEIYFGDIQVPLHVLYSYGSDEDADSKQKKTTASSSKYRRPSATALKQEREKNRITQKVNQRIEMLKTCVKLARIKGIKYVNLFRGCLSDVERIDKIIRVLEAHGLEGEPTFAKCRELGEQQERLAEAKELDPSAIINPNERVLRSGKTHPVIEEEDFHENSIKDEESEI